jgi:hypothetical protein
MISSNNFADRVWILLKELEAREDDATFVLNGTLDSLNLIEAAFHTD